MRNPVCSPCETQNQSIAIFHTKIEIDLCAHWGLAGEERERASAYKIQNKRMQFLFDSIFVFLKRRSQLENLQRVFHIFVYEKCPDRRSWEKKAKC